MPAGYSWPRYICFLTVAYITMMAGAQTVHVIYKPLNDIDKLVDDALKELEKK